MNNKKRHQIISQLREKRRRNWVKVKSKMKSKFWKNSNFWNQLNPLVLESKSRPKTTRVAGKLKKPNSIIKCRKLNKKSWSCISSKRSRSKVANVHLIPSWQVLQLKYWHVSAEILSLLPMSPNTNIRK